MNEERIIARGLRPPGPLLLVRKKIEEGAAGHLRVIVSFEDSARELVEFFEETGIPVETDRAGDDIHVVADLSGRRNGDIE